MSDMKNFISQYESVLKLIKQAGFGEAIIFKGFCDNEEHNLNLLIKDLPKSDSHAMPLTRRITQLNEGLTKLLNCTVTISTHRSMDSYYLQKLDKTNSVKLLDADATIIQLEKVFGKDWKFNLSNTSDAFLKEIHDEEYTRHRERNIKFFNLYEEKNIEILPSLKSFSHELASTSPEKREATLKHLAEDLKALGYEIEIKNIHPAQQPKIINALS